MIEETLNRLVRQKKDSSVREAMLYSLIDGGKRLRPQIVMAMVEDFGGDSKAALIAGSALEMVHTYSLIHDDLPAMDDDDFRRHKPSNHKTYGEALALLAGDGLLSLAFEVLSNMEIEATKVKECVRILSDAAGINGMILGQEYDLNSKEENLIELEVTYALKTGKLFAAALEMAAVIRGHYDLQGFVHRLGLKIGIAFQMQDDFLEKSSSFEILGKDLDSDAKRAKLSVLDFMSEEESKNYLNDLFKSIDDDIKEITSKKALLKVIAGIKVRKY